MSITEGAEPRGELHAKLQQAIDLLATPEAAKKDEAVQMLKELCSEGR